MDKLREIKISIKNDMIGKPVVFEGKEVGRVIDVDGNNIICSINSDIVSQIMRGNNRSFSLEVVRQ